MLRISTMSAAGSASSDARLHLILSSEAMAERVAGVLTDHRVVFERNGESIVAVGPEKHSRIVAMLRQVLREVERRQVQVFAGLENQFPEPKLIDEWWRIHETGWFGRAMAEDRFSTWFQPVVDTENHAVIGHECLTRLIWGRTYSGAEILDAAWVRDEMGAFDDYARTLAIRSAARQSLAGCYFVNLVPSLITNPQLCLANTMQVMRETGLRPENLVFELGDWSLCEDTGNLHAIADLYRSEGYRVALDDFGPSASALQLLRELKPDFIKLSRNIVRSVEHPMQGSMVRKAAELSDRYGVCLVAKGVERTHIMENLWLLGVRLMQGYLFGRPSQKITETGSQLLSLANALLPAARVLESVH